MPELGLPASLSNNIKKKKTWSTLSSLAQQKKKGIQPLYPPSLNKCLVRFFVGEP